MRRLLPGSALLLLLATSACRSARPAPVSVRAEDIEDDGTGAREELASLRQRWAAVATGDASCGTPPESPPK